MDRDRRWMLAAGGALVLSAGAAWRVAGGRRTPFAFEWLDSPKGFRRAHWDGAATTERFNPLIGVGGGRDAPQSLIGEDDGALCAALFGGSPEPGVTPVAVFSDYFCPYCKTLVPEVAEIAAESGGAVSVRWHEWPLFGERSMASARAAMAADLQGAYDAFSERLLGSSFVVTPGYLDALAHLAGIDAAQLKADMKGEAVSRRIAESLELARRFGFAGTPSLVVGRSAIEGAISRRALLDLIAVERETGPIAAC